MADLLTHVAVANLGAKASRDDRVRALVLAGTCLPDILFKGLLYGTGSSTWAAEASHAPLPIVAFCYGAALLFEEPFRPRAFVALAAGMFLHILIDAGKDYMGQGVILWLFPFTMDRIELALYRPEETIFMTIGAAALLVGTELVFRALKSPRPGR